MRKSVIIVWNILISASMKRKMDGVKLNSNDLDDRVRKNGHKIQQTVLDFTKFHKSPLIYHFIASSFDCIPYIKTLSYQNIVCRQREIVRVFFLLNASAQA